MATVIFLTKYLAYARKELQQCCLKFGRYTTRF